MLRLMGDLLKLIWCFVIELFRSRDAREAGIVALRHQLNVLRRKAPKRLVFSNCDRFVFTCLYRLVPGILNTLVIVKPETVIRWHRAGFRLFWRWKSRTRGGRPNVPLEIRQLIRDMSLANPFWALPGSTANCSNSACQRHNRHLAFLLSNLNVLSQPRRIDLQPMLRLIVLFRRRTRLSSITVRDSSWSCGVGVTLRSRRDIWLPLSTKCLSGALRE